MIHIAQAIIVEGKYDKIKLSSILDAVILVTNGFHIFHDAEKMSLIRYYAKTTGVIILTDSDTAGFKIRHYLKGAVHEGKLYHVYIPDIYGKERRKDKPSAEGKLGVEGIDKKRLLEAFGKAGILAEEAPEQTRSPSWTCTNWDFPAEQTARTAAKPCKKSWDCRNCFLRHLCWKC